MRYLNDSDALFCRAPLHTAIENQCAAAVDQVQRISETVLRAVGNENLATQIAANLDIEPLQLLRENMTMQREEVRIDVTNDPNRIPRWDGGRMFVPGVQVTVSVPYTGDSSLWRLRPSSFRLVVTKGVVKPSSRNQGGVLDLTFKLPNDQSFEKIKQQLDSDLSDIQFSIDAQKKDLEGVASKVQNATLQALIARRERLQKQDGLSSLLGIPEIKSEKLKESGIQSSRNIAPKTFITNEKPIITKAIEEWDVFVSHASEDKDSFVRSLATALTNKGLRVWYDEQTLSVGDSLRRSIDKGLARSRYGIVVISPAFLSKHWPQKELDGLVAKEEDGNKVILPIWHNITAFEVRQSSPTLADRLAVNSTSGVDAVVCELMRILRPA